MNAIDWNRRDTEIETVQFVKFLLQLRKKNPCFRYDDYEMMRANIRLENIQHRMIKYQLHQNEGQYQDIIIFMNASLEILEVEVEDGYTVLYHSDKGKIVNNKLTVEGAGLVILVRYK